MVIPVPGALPLAGLCGVQHLGDQSVSVSWVFLAALSRKSRAAPFYPNALAAVTQR